MRRFAVLFVCLALFVLAGTVSAQTTDVPQNHWAYDAVQDLANKGYVTGYPDGTFLGGRALTRYEFATVVKRILDNVEGRISASENGSTAPSTTATPAPANSGVSPEDVDRITKLTDEFKVELTVIGTRLDAVEATVADLEARFGTVEAITTDPEGALEATRADVSKLKKITLSGYVQARYELFPDDVDADGKTVDSSFNLRRARIKLTAKPSDYTTGVIQLDTGGNKVGVKDAYITYDFNSNPVSGPDISVGQMAWPFGYEVVYSSSRREVPERALWSRRLFPGERDRGLKILYPFAKNWTLQAGIFDGTGIDSFNTITTVVTDASTTPPTTTDLKTSSNVNKDFDGNKDFVGNLQYIGGKYEFGLSAYLGKGVWNADRADTVTTVDKTRYGADFRYFMNNITLKGEYVHAKGVDEVPTFTDWIDGWNAQINYNLDTENILVARYDTLSDDPKKPAFGRRSAWNLGVIRWLDDKTRVKLFYQDNKEETGEISNNMWTAEWIMTY